MLLYGMLYTFICVVCKLFSLEIAGSFYHGDFPVFRSTDRSCSSFACICVTILKMNEMINVTLSPRALLFFSSYIPVCDSSPQSPQEGAVL